MSTLRVMTFNVFNSEIAEEEPEGPHELWQHRAALNVRTIKRYAPDLIGFQELGRAQWDTYGEHLAEYDRFPDHKDDPEMSSAIFWKSARFQLTQGGKFWLSRTPDQPTADWGVPYPLCVTWVKLTDRSSGLSSLHLNTQFEDGPDGDVSRPESGKLIVAKVEQLRENNRLPVVLTGDFNCNPWSPAYRTFVENGWTDAYRAAGNADNVESSTFHGFQGRNYFSLEWGDQLFWRVDWILTLSGTQHVQTTSCTIVRDAEPPLYPSDHYPVVAELMFLER